MTERVENGMLREGGTSGRKITVVGLGYIGLPTAAMLATHGHTVYGFDTNARVIEHLEKGKVHIEEPGLLAFVRDALHSGRFVPVREVRPADVYILCVPTPYDSKEKRADLSYITKAAETIVPHLKKGDLAILESTVPAGTTADHLGPILARSGLDPLRDLDLAHCPETVLPGNMISELTSNARVIGGLTPKATQAAEMLYRSFVRGTLVTTDATTAEFVKLIQNTYRDVNIALANEIGMVAGQKGIDVREAIRIANLHPRVDLHAPGPGVGGHCIPIDPWFLVQDTPEARLVRVSREINDGMPHRVVDKVRSLVQHIDEPRIALLGIAYKADVDDVRESPAVPILEELKEHFGDVRVHDPHVKDPRFDLVPLKGALEGADCTVIVTGHWEYSALDPHKTRSVVRTPLVLDTRGVLSRREWQEAGFRFETA